jgi:hypothetical protein
MCSGEEGVRSVYATPLATYRPMDLYAVRLNESIRVLRTSAFTSAYRKRSSPTKMADGRATRGAYRCMERAAAPHSAEGASVRDYAVRYSKHD